MNVSPAQGGTVKIDQTAAASYPAASSFEAGASIQLEAIPAEGYEFAGWKGSLAGRDNPANLEMTCDKAITATFIEKGRFFLTIETGGSGSVAPSSGRHSYPEGTVVNITAVPGTGYRFDSWTGDVVDASSASTTIILGSNKTIAANFSRVTHTLTIAVKGPGSVVPFLGDRSYIEGTLVNIAAAPEDGYRFDGWTGEVDDAASANTAVTLDSDKTITANFSQANPPFGMLLGIGLAGAAAVAAVSIWLVRRRSYHCT